LAKRFRIIRSAKAAYRQSWDDRAEILQVAWLTVLITFVLLSVPMLAPALKHPCRIAVKILFAVVAVALLRKDILGEKPAMKKVAGIPFYFRFGRREALYGAWSCVIIAVFYVTGKAEALAHHLPYIGPLVAALVWPLLRDLFLSMIILVRPYIAVTDKPSFDALNGLIEAVIGNIGSILMTVITIFAPYFIMTAVFYFFSEYIGFRNAWHYTEQIFYSICAIVELKFISNLYNTLYKDQPPASSPR
jgi:hypothetical protein